MQRVVWRCLELERVLEQMLDRIIERGLDEGKQLIWIVIYFWVLFGVFTVFRALVLNEQNLIYHQGFAFINAWLLAKVVLTAEFFQVAENLKHKPLVYPIIYKSAVFCLILMCFYVVEETVVGLWHGKTVVASFPAIGGGGWRGMLVVGSILFIAMIPFFAYRELARVLGKEQLYSLIFRRGADTTLIHSPQ
ncbi:MAG: hypothetical protein WAK32_06380 [Xanthobacteraceae bacterium]